MGKGGSGYVDSLAAHETRAREGETTVSIGPDYYR